MRIGDSSDFENSNFARSRQDSTRTGLTFLQLTTQRTRVTRKSKRRLRNNSKMLRNFRLLLSLIICLVDNGVRLQVSALHIML